MGINIEVRFQFLVRVAMGKAEVGQREAYDKVFDSLPNLVVSGQKSTWNEQTVLLEDCPDQGMTH